MEVRDLGCRHDSLRTTQFLEQGDIAVLVFDLTAEESRPPLVLATGICFWELTGLQIAQVMYAAEVHNFPSEPSLPFDI